MDTPMVEKSKLYEDTKGKAVDPSHYRGMIGTLLYLTATRPDLQFAICMSFTDADHAGFQDTRRSTSGSMQFLGHRLIRWSSKRSKHIDIRYTLSRRMLRMGIEFLSDKLGMKTMSPDTLKKLADEVDE
ncbi:integrase, catalytic region, zinc finger, CCHC-type containing protein [Tanacetum coccineum]